MSRAEHRLWVPRGRSEAPTVCLWCHLAPGRWEHQLESCEAGPATVLITLSPSPVRSTPQDESLGEWASEEVLCPNLSLGSVAARSLICSLIVTAWFLL